jgi:hypothetical protein
MTAGTTTFATASMANPRVPVASSGIPIAHAPESAATTMAVSIAVRIAVRLAGPFSSCGVVMTAHRNVRGADARSNSIG